MIAINLPEKFIPEYIQNYLTRKEKEKDPLSKEKPRSNHLKKELCQKKARKTTKRKSKKDQR